MNKKIRKIADYCRENIEFFEDRVDVALKAMKIMNFPLFEADNFLCDEIEQSIKEYCEEYKWNPNEFTADDIVYVFNS